MKIQLCSLIVVFTLLTIALAASDVYGAAYIKFDGIDGEAQDKEHKGWSDLLSVSDALSQIRTQTEARRAGDIIIEDILITKELDKASPKIAESIVKGKIFPKVEIHLTASFGDIQRVTYYAYELTNVMVTSYSISGTGEDIPIEDIILNFEELRLIDFTQTIRVPGWIKNNAGWWAAEQIDDKAFMDGIQYMINEKIINIPDLPEQASEIAEEHVPDWVRNNAGWWADGLISEDDFVNGIKYLVEHGIIKI